MDDSGKRGHDQELFKKKLRLEVTKSALSNRVIDNMNLLPSQMCKLSYSQHLSEISCS